MHDIGRIVQRENHSKFSAEIVEKWLENNLNIKSQIYDVEKLLNMIKNHSCKDQKEEDFGFAVFKDADELDEIGILSIFMASNRLDKKSPYFFNFLLDRVNNFEIKFCNETMKKLNTESAIKILSEKKKFIESFINQLDNEIDGTHSLLVVYFKEVNWNL